MNTPKRKIDKPSLILNIFNTYIDWGLGKSPDFPVCDMEILFYGSKNYNRGDISDEKILYSLII